MIHTHAANLFKLENVIVKLQLQHFVAKVDAKLLKRVDVKHFKSVYQIHMSHTYRQHVGQATIRCIPENIQQAEALKNTTITGPGSGSAHIAIGDGVQAPHQTIELPTIQLTCQRWMKMK